MYVYSTGIINTICVLVTIEVDEANIKPQNPNIIDKTNATYNISIGKIIKIIDENCKEYNTVSIYHNGRFSKDYVLGENIIREITIFLTKIRALNQKKSKNYTGIHYNYHTNGQICKISHYINGLESLEQESYYENGNLSSKTIYYTSDKNTTYMQKFYPDGKTLQEESYHNCLNQIIGDLKNFDKNGNLLSHKFYQNGKMTDMLANTDQKILCEKIFNETEIYYLNIPNENNPQSKGIIINNIQYFLKQIENIDSYNYTNKRLLKIKIVIYLFQYLNLDYIINFIESNSNFKNTVLNKIKDIEEEPNNLEETIKLKELSIMLKNKLVNNLVQLEE